MPRLDGTSEPSERIALRLGPRPTSADVERLRHGDLLDPMLGGYDERLEVPAHPQTNGHVYR
jgi:hypothetical protein